MNGPIVLWAVPEPAFTDVTLELLRPVVAEFVFRAVSVGEAAESRMAVPPEPCSLSSGGG
jgi:hypothetical protein